MRGSLAVVAAALAVASPSSARSQSGSAAGHAHSPAAVDAAVDAAVTSAMAGPPSVSPHMTLTAPRPGTRRDSVRAAAIADTLKRAIARFTDVRVAEAEGFQIFAPQVKQETYHFTNYRRALAGFFRGFDPAEPSSLLYRKTPAGGFVLVGAMYTAPKNATPDELDARVPLSIARWHAHTNVCLPPVRGGREAWTAARDGRLLFGLGGSITTAAACETEGGRFHAQLFGWMVHANVYAGDSTPIWGETHMAHPH